MGAALWLASLTLPAPAIYGAWAVALIIELLAPILVVRTLDEPRVTFHPRHIPERYGLFTIIVLGESVNALPSPTELTYSLRALPSSGFSVARTMITQVYPKRARSPFLPPQPRGPKVNEVIEVTGNQHE